MRMRGKGLDKLDQRCLRHSDSWNACGLNLGREICVCVERGSTSSTNAACVMSL